MNFIKRLRDKFNSKVNDDWEEIDTPSDMDVKHNKIGNTDSIMIPADGNNRIFDKGGTVIPPRRNSGNKKYFFFN